MSLTHLSAVDALKAFPNDPLLGERATILLILDPPRTIDLHHGRPVGAMPRVSQAETWELAASKLWGVCYPAELQRPAPLKPSRVHYFHIS